MINNQWRFGLGTARLEVNGATVATIRMTDAHMWRIDGRNRINWQDLTEAMREVEFALPNPAPAEQKGRE